MPTRPLLDSKPVPPAEYACVYRLPVTVFMGGTIAPWPLTLCFEDRVLLVVAYWRTNLTMPQLALLFDVASPRSTALSMAWGQRLALIQRQRFHKGTVLIVDGTLAPTRDHAFAHRPRDPSPPQARAGRAHPLEGKAQQIAQADPSPRRNAMLGIAQLQSLALTQ